NEKYVKFLPISDETFVTNNHNSTTDNGQLSREDLKYSVKIFLRSLDPELLHQTIDTGLFRVQYR
ncbi:unnamed protein product, partial [Rotaria magnacalcarata]